LEYAYWVSLNQSQSVPETPGRWNLNRAAKYIVPFSSVTWLVHLLLSILIPTRVPEPNYKKNATNRLNYAYCSLFAPSNVTIALYMFLLCVSDGLCLCLMACSSVSIVSILCIHKRQVKHIHSAQHFLKVSPEDRATKTILILLCVFSISYSFSSILAVFKGPAPNI
jgi:vomeronasal1 receptor